MCGVADKPGDASAQFYSRRPTRSFCLFVPADDFGHLEDGQEHTDDHATHNHAQEHNEDWLNQRSQSRKSGFDLIIQKVRNTFEHIVDLAGLFTGRHHADNHHREHRMFAQRHGNAFAAFDIQSGCFDGFFHDDIPDCLRNDLQYFKDGNTAANQRSERPRETGQTDFMGDGPKNREFNAISIPKGSAGGRLDEIEPSINSTAAAQQDQEDESLNEMAQVDKELSRGWQTGAKTLKDFTKHGDHFNEQENRDEDRHDRHDSGIHHG